MLDEHGVPALHLIQDEDAAHMLIQTRRGNYKCFTPREVKLACTVREAKVMVASPSEALLKEAGSGE